MDILTKEYYLNINSADRVRGTNSNFFIQFQGLDIERNKPYKMEVKSVIFPNTIYQIDSYNNYFTFTEGANPAVGLTIPTGNYTIDEFTSQIKTLLDGANADTQTYTVTYNEKRNKIDIVRSASTDYTLNFLSNYRTHLLFGANVGSITHQVGKITFPNQVDLVPYKNIYILNTKISNENFITNTVNFGKNVLLNMSLAAPRNTIIYFHENELQSNRILLSEFGGQHNFIILNDWGEQVTYEGEIQMCLKLTAV